MVRKLAEYKNCGNVKHQDNEENLSEMLSGFRKDWWNDSFSGNCKSKWERTSCVINILSVIKKTKKSSKKVKPYFISKS